MNRGFQLVKAGAVAAAFTSVIASQAKNNARTSSFLCVNPWILLVFVFHHRAGQNFFSGQLLILTLHYSCTMGPFAVACWLHPARGLATRRNAVSGKRSCRS